MTPNDIELFMERHRLTLEQLATLLGVTIGGVKHWLSGRRAAGITTVRLLKLFDKYPQLMHEFGK